MSPAQARTRAFKRSLRPDTRGLILVHMPLHAFLTAKHHEVLKRWLDLVRGTLAPESMPRIELLDDMPKFLQDIIAVLRTDAGRTAPVRAEQDSPNAAGHGGQRLRLGFSLDSIVREYGALRTAIVATAADAGIPIEIRELDILHDLLITGIANAVSAYAQQRDAQLARQANEHFAFIAHELRDPLSSASMAFGLLKSTGQLPVQSKTVDCLDRGLQRTAELIDETLKIARVASGIDLRRERTTLAALVEEARLGALSQAESKNIDVRVTIEHVDEVKLDRRLVRSAISNLLRNGIKYTPSGGVVHLRARVASARAVIEVEDSCGGLPPGKAEKVFAPFVRLDTRQGGFGLGLAIAKQAVDAHGGTIRVQDLPGKGCMFVLELPIGGADPSLG
jgi:signal transduction histidine kinase